MKTFTFLFIASFSFLSTAVAGNFDQNKLYVGVGFGVNFLNKFSDTTGYQLFTGYKINNEGMSNKLETYVELGFADSGDFDSQTSNQSRSFFGYWLTGITQYKIVKNLRVLGRYGVDVGDDEGYLFGAGIEYRFIKKAFIRGEYIVRDDINSLQLNFVKKI